ncbi:MAG: CAP domain-containing protein [Candidatus Methylacidiphilales bacterium]
MRDKLKLITGLAVAAACLFFTMAPRPAMAAEGESSGHTNNHSPPISILDEVLEKHIINVVNDYRKENGVPPLVEDEGLTKIARKTSKLHAFGSYGNIYQAHTLWAARFVEITKENPYIYEAAENFAHLWPDVDLAGQTVQLWARKQRQNRNMLYKWNLTGCGVTMDTEGDVYILQIYARGKQYDPKDMKDIDPKRMAAY